MELTFKIPEELEEDVKKVSKAELSLAIMRLLKLEIARRARLLEAREKFKRIVSKSKFTEEDADELAEKVKLSMHNHIKEEGLV